MNPIKLSANESHHGPSPLAVEAYRQSFGTAVPLPGRRAEPSCAVPSPRRSGCASQGIVCGNGSDELLQLLIRAYVRPGDDVVFSRHSLCDGRRACHGAGRTHRDGRRAASCVPIRTRCWQAMTPQTRTVIIASPNNPVGRYLPRAELGRLRRGLPAETDPDRRCSVCRLCRCGRFRAGPALVDAGSNTVMTRTFSKLYGLAGLRIGWMYGPANIVDAVERIRTPFNASADAMAAATAAVRDVRYTQFVRDYNIAQLRRIEAGVIALGEGIEFVTEPSPTSTCCDSSTTVTRPEGAAAGARATAASSRGRSPPAVRRAACASPWVCSTRTMPCSAFWQTTWRTDPATPERAMSRVHAISDATRRFLAEPRPFFVDGQWLRGADETRRRLRSIPLPGGDRQLPRRAVDDVHASRRRGEDRASTTRAGAA